MNCAARSGVIASTLCCCMVYIVEVSTYNTYIYGLLCVNFRALT